MGKCTNWLAGAAAALALALAPAAATAQDWPEPGKTIHMLIGYSAGGGTDLAARLLATALGDKLGTSVVVENYTTGGGLEAINRTLAAAPDGYTIALVPLPAANMLYLDKQRGGTFTMDDLTIVATHDYSVLTITTAADNKWQTLGDVIDALKKEPNSVTAASSGVLSNGHLGLLAFNKAAGVTANWTTFDNAGLMRTALLGHHIDLEFSGIGEVQAGVKSGDLRILAVLSEDRLPDFPDVPTARELGVDVIAQSTRVIIAPKGTPANVVEKLEAAVQALVADPAYQAKAHDLQVALFFQDQAKTTQFWKDTDATFGPLVATFRAQQ
jgi:tripartite-type tricarboxylate transporter receptor subunit TctC